MSADDSLGMQFAIESAREAQALGEIPIGAVLVRENQILARAFNRREADKNPLHHAEMLVLEEAARNLGDWRLSATTLYVTLEPCPMCLGALLQARVPRLVFGCSDPKRAPVVADEAILFPPLPLKTVVRGNNHELEVVGGIESSVCSQILKDFFKLRRTL